MTTPPHPRPHSNVRPRARAVTVPPSGFGLNAPIITSPCRLMGWSLSPAGQGDPTIAASVQAAAAAAGTLTMTGFFGVSQVVVTPAGAWPAVAGVVTVSNVTGGPITAEIPQGTEQPIVISFSPPIGVTGTPTATVPALVGGPAYTIEAVGLNSTANAASTGAAATIQDGGQVVGAVTTPPNLSKTDWLGGDGVYIGTSIALNVSLGSLSGVIYVLDGWHGGDN